MHQPLRPRTTGSRVSVSQSHVLTDLGQSTMFLSYWESILPNSSAFSVLYFQWLLSWVLCKPPEIESWHQPKIWETMKKLTRGTNTHMFKHTSFLIHQLWCLNEPYLSEQQELTNEQSSCQFNFCGIKWRQFFEAICTTSFKTNNKSMDLPLFHDHNPIQTSPVFFKYIIEELYLMFKQKKCSHTKLGRSQKMMELRY